MKSDNQNGKVAVVVVTYNRKELLKECVDALLNQTRSLDLIILIDNASTDGTWAFLKEKGYLTNQKIDYLKLPENIGSSGGFHEGIKRAYEKNFDWIWIMDDDAEPINNSLEMLLKNEKIKENKVGILASVVIYPNNQICYFHRCNFNASKMSFRSIGSSMYSENTFEADMVSFVGMLVNKMMVRDIGLPLKKFLYIPMMQNIL
jgi:GT2 family glycosyltransferase